MHTGIIWKNNREMVFMLEHAVHVKQIQHAYHIKTWNGIPFV